MESSWHCRWTPLGPSLDYAPMCVTERRSRMRPHHDAVFGRLTRMPRRRGHGASGSCSSSAALLGDRPSSAPSRFSISCWSVWQFRPGHRRAAVPQSRPLMHMRRRRTGWPCVIVTDHALSGRRGPAQVRLLAEYRYGARCTAQHWLRRWQCIRLTRVSTGPTGRLAVGVPLHGCRICRRIPWPTMRLAFRRSCVR